MKTALFSRPLQFHASGLTSLVETCFVTDIKRMTNMVAITGKYLHVRNDNIDEYFKSLGVPYLVRKMMAVSHPTLEITRNDDKWTLKNITLISTKEDTFTLGEEYEEVMPSGDKLQSVTTLEGNSLVIVSRTQDGNKVVRRYDFSDEEVILTMSQERSDQIGKRYYKRVL